MIEIRPQLTVGGFHDAPRSARPLTVSVTCRSTHTTHDH